jgi:tetratricopeptide (TPR) repeat protein
MKKLYDLQDVCRLAGVSESQVRYWDKVGLITHADRQGGRILFDFKALVAFRTVKALLNKGISTRKVRQCIETLRKQMPRVAEPLTELRITVQGAEIVIGKDSMTFTPEGQILMQFETPDRGETAAPFPSDEVEELFFQALDLEDDGLFHLARKKYAALLARKPDHVDSLVNLGSIYYRLGVPEIAEDCYRKALRFDPDHTEGNYNLANLLEEQGDDKNAVLFYTKTLREDPDFADAHFNLGRVLERVGDLEGAQEHWRRYLELDGSSEWADYLRRRLEGKDPGPEVK